MNPGRQRLKPVGLWDRQWVQAHTPSAGRGVTSGWAGGFSEAACLATIGPSLASRVTRSILAGWRRAAEATVSSSRFRFFWCRARRDLPAKISRICGRSDRARIESLQLAHRGEDDLLLRVLVVPEPDRLGPLGADVESAGVLDGRVVVVDLRPHRQRHGNHRIGARPTMAGPETTTPVSEQVVPSVPTTAYAQRGPHWCTRPVSVQTHDPSRRSLIRHVSRLHR